MGGRGGGGEYQGGEISLFDVFDDGLESGGVEGPTISNDSLNEIGVFCEMEIALHDSLQPLLWREIVFPRIPYLEK